MFANGIDSEATDMPFPAKTKVHLDHALIDMESSPPNLKVYMSVISDEWMTLSKLVTMKSYTFYAKVDLPFVKNLKWNFGGSERLQIFSQEVNAFIEQFLPLFWYVW